MRIALAVVCAGLATLVACGDNLQGNRAPTASDSNVTTPEDTPVSITVSASDPDPDDGLQFGFSQPEHGTITAEGGTVTYRPADDYNGPDATFEYTVSDGVANDVGTVTVAVGGQNDPPVAVDDTRTTAEDTAATITAASLVANDTDAEMQALSVTLVNGATNGTVSLNAGTI